MLTSTTKTQGRVWAYTHMHVCTHTHTYTHILARTQTCLRVQCLHHGLHQGGAAASSAAGWLAMAELLLKEGAPEAALDAAKQVGKGHYSSGFC